MSMSIERDDIMRKVRGLLAKAADEAVTEEEAGSFLAKANELMIRYSIAEEDLGNPAEENKYGTTVIWSGRTAPFLVNLYTSLLEKHFNVKPVRVHLRRGMQQIILYGKHDDCTWATYVYEFLTAKFNQLWLHYKRYDPTVIESHRTSYYFGLHDGLDAKLTEAKQAVANETIKGKNALVVLSNNLQEAVNRDLPGLKSTRKTFDIKSEEARDAGKVDGRAIEIMRPLPGKSNATRITS
jgi:uncharacterized protein DUF2786